jgi:hypothetical protein
MSETKHTPVPWGFSGPVECRGSLAYVVTAAEPRMQEGSWEVAQLDTGTDPAEAKNPDKIDLLCDELTIANARLVVASPEMFAFIKGLSERDWHRGTLMLDSEEQAEIKTILAKVEGDLTNA